MYKFNVRPEFGRELAAQQLKQHRSRQFNNSSLESAGYFLLSFLYKNRRVGQLTSALLAGCVVSILAGCGGVTHNSTTIALNTISCGTQSLTGAQTTACSVNLSSPAKSSAAVTLTSNNAALNVPTTIVVAAGATTAGFHAVSEAVSKAVSVTITAEMDSVTKTDVITLNPVASPTPSPTPAPVASLSKVSCATQTLTGPTTAACSVYLSAAAASQTVVALASSNGALRAPASVNVPAGQTSAGFSVTVSAVSSPETATLTATADGVSQMDAITLAPSAGPTPAPVATLSKLSCATQTLIGPTTTACSVYLSAAATSQTVVKLSSSSSALQAPVSVDVAVGATSASFNVKASALSSKQTALLTATANGVSQMDSITLDPATTTTPPSAPVATLSKLSCAMQTLTGPTTTACSVYLSAAATSQTVVMLSSNNKALQPPISVNVAAGATSAAFNVTASAMSTKQTVTLTATANGVSQIDAITLNPATSAPVATLNKLSCATQTLTGPTWMQCSVYLSAAATSQTVVTLSSSNKALQPPASVNVAAGATSAAFNVTVSALSTKQTVTLTATGDGVSQMQAITLNPATSAPAATLSKLSCATQTLTGPTTTACSVYLSSAAASQTVVTLSSNNKALQSPASVSVAAGATSVAFNVTASALSTAQAVTLTATANGVSQAAVIQLEGATAQPATQHAVQLSWNAPAPTSDPVVGYHVYRATSGDRIMRCSLPHPTHRPATTIRRSQADSRTTTSLRASTATE